MKTLKHYGQLAVLFIAAAMLTVSCSKDKQLEKDIEGTWNATKKSEEDNSQRITKKVNGEQTTWSLEVTAEGTYNFESDNTGDYNLDYKQVWYKDGNKQDELQFTFSSDFDWEVKDEKLHITYNQASYHSQEEVYVIKENSDNEMVLDEDSDESGTYSMSYTDDQGNTINLDIYYNLTLNK